MMERRTFIAGAATLPLAGAAQAALANSEIQRLFLKWQALTEKYLTVERKWHRKDIDEFEFEDITDPILNCRDAVENAILAQDSVSLDDLAIKAHIAAYFDWSFEVFNLSIGRDVQKMAGAKAIALAT